MRQEKRMGNPGKNNIFVGSRSGGPMEQSRTKQASIKHQNPEYFKRQTDRKHHDASLGKLEKYNAEEHKGMKMAMHANEMEKKAEHSKHRDNLIKGYSDPKAGRGIGQIGTRDMSKKDNRLPKSELPIQRDFNHHQKNVGKDVGRGVGQIGRDQAPFPVKQFAKGTMY